MQIKRPVITNVEVWPVRQPVNKQSYAVIRVSTDAGVAGWGELAVRADAGAAVRLLDFYRRDLIGQDASRVEHVRMLLDAKLTAHGSAGASPSRSSLDGFDVLAAVNMAQLDILGKLSRAPAYELLGGPTRNKARALAPLSGDNETALLGSLDRAREAGFRAVRVPLLIPAGPTRGRGFYERVRQLLERMRSAHVDMDFVLDCGGQTTAAEAVTLANSLERFHLMWLDEPTSQIQQKALSGLGEESATPIGWGRNALANSDFQDLLRQDAVDVLRPDVSRFGITSIRKAAALAETYYVAVAPYHSGGPIATAAALHVAASIPNFYIQEVPFPVDEADRRMRRELAGSLESPTDGFFALPAGPGLGISITEETLQKYRVDG